MSSIGREIEQAVNEELRKRREAEKGNEPGVVVLLRMLLKRGGDVEEMDAVEDAVEVFLNAWRAGKLCRSVGGRWFIDDGSMGTHAGV